MSSTGKPPAKKRKMKAQRIAEWKKKRKAELRKQPAALRADMAAINRHFRSI